MCVCVGSATIRKDVGKSRKAIAFATKITSEAGWFLKSVALVLD